jgi:CubicO group peptidase (beta-lactamase class C family)
MRPLLLVGSLLLSLLSVNAARGQSPAAQQSLDSLRTKYHLPALLAAIIEPGRIRYVYAGVKRNDQANPVRLADYFHLGSDTKGVTSLLAAKLVEQGKLRWDSKLLDVVPALRAKTLPAYTSITLGELLSHRAGIRPYRLGSDHYHLPKFTGTVSQKRLQFAAVVLQEPPVAASSTQPYVYSNAGYVLATLMLEQASHRSWEQLVAHTFYHLGLKQRVGFPNHLDATQPWGHELKSSQDSLFRPLGPDDPYQLLDYMAPAGDLAMPLPDFARLVQLHLTGLLGHSNYLAASTYQQLHFGQPAYAYGWGVTTFAATGAPLSYHDGSAGTFFCSAYLYPSLQVAIVVLTNAGDPPAAQACAALRVRLRKLYTQGAL